LIVLQKDGKVLLDTLLATSKDHALKVRSDDAKFDFTTIYPDPAISRYYIDTYVQVSKDKWHLNKSSVPVSWGETELATIDYSNIPYDMLFHFESIQISEWGSSWSNNNQTIQYNRLLPTDLVYMLLPKHRKYMFTEVTSTKTYVDFSKASTAGIRKYTKPAGVTNFSSLLFGYRKAGDRTSRMLLYLPLLPSEEYDFQFPTTVIEEFDLSLSYTDAEGYHHKYSHTGKTIPAEMNFAAKSDFKVTKSEVNDFQITFGEDKPSSYSTFWEADADLKAHWNIYFSPEETAFQPKTYLEGLKAEWLAGKDLSSITLHSVYSQKAITSSESSPINEIKQSRTIIKTFK
jgi:hypothetical protein